ncbi:hypothetical protein [Comamonas sp. GB3 AK4-5]|uniref:hypothetical protein n=1 Tax=Comamonas sp. GB3 AK4-5 TaxID=3231487 RepID=UPI00351EE4CA
MAFKRLLVLLTVLLMSALLRDMVVPRECVEEWVDRCMRTGTADSTDNDRRPDLP